MIQNALDSTSLSYVEPRGAYFFLRCRKGKVGVRLTITGVTLTDYCR
jgi:hypothetical protein